MHKDLLLREADCIRWADENRTDKSNEIALLLNSYSSIPLKFEIGSETFSGNLLDYIAYSSPSLFEKVVSKLNPQNNWSISLLILLLSDLDLDFLKEAVESNKLRIKSESRIFSSSFPVFFDKYARIKSESKIFSNSFPVFFDKYADRFIDIFVSFSKASKHKLFEGSIDRLLSEYVFSIERGSALDKEKYLNFIDKLPANKTTNKAVYSILRSLAYERLKIVHPDLDLHILRLRAVIRLLNKNNSSNLNKSLKNLFSKRLKFLITYHFSIDKKLLADFLDLLENSLDRTLIEDALVDSIKFSSHIENIYYASIEKGYTISEDLLEREFKILRQNILSASNIWGQVSCLLRAADLSKLLNKDFSEDKFKKIEYKYIFKRADDKLKNLIIKSINRIEPSLLSSNRELKKLAQSFLGKKKRKI